MLQLACNAAPQIVTIRLDDLLNSLKLSCGWNKHARVSTVASVDMRTVGLTFQYLRQSSLPWTWALAFAGLKNFKYEVIFQSFVCVRTAALTTSLLKLNLVRGKKFFFSLNLTLLSLGFTSLLVEKLTGLRWSAAFVVCLPAVWTGCSSGRDAGKIKRI